MQYAQERLALKTLVDTFSNLADEKRVSEQMALFTPDAVVDTYIGGERVFHMEGHAQIEKTFADYLAPFHAVYHINGQQTLTFTDDGRAQGTHYCLVKLLGTAQNGKPALLEHSVRYTDSYVKRHGTWLIEKRTAHFMISETRELPDPA